MDSDKTALDAILEAAEAAQGITPPSEAARTRPPRNADKERRRAMRAANRRHNDDKDTTEAELKELARRGSHIHKQAFVAQHGSFCRR